MIKKKLLLFFCFFSLSCSGTSYLCWNEIKTEAIAFSYGLGTITVDDSRIYNMIYSQKKPLNSEMPGGSYVLKIEPSLITLERIQDTVYVRVKLPSGEFLETFSYIEDIEDYLNQIRYHAVYPVVRKYVFDKEALSLSYSATPLFKPRSAIEQKLVNYNEETQRGTFKETRNLSPQEAFDILQIDKRAYSYEYPRCEDESFSIKRILRYLLKPFFTV